MVNPIIDFFLSLTYLARGFSYLIWLVLLDFCGSFQFFFVLLDIMGYTFIYIFRNRNFTNVSF